MSQLAGLALAQTQSGQRGRPPAASQPDHRLEQSGRTGASSGSTREPSSTGGSSTGNALVSDGGTK